MQKFDMQAHFFPRLGCAVLAGFAMTLSSGHVHAQIDGAFIQKAAPERAASAVSNDIPDYESDYAAASRLQNKIGSTPEADARPGEYYFLLGADAYRKRNYAFAIQMYQVAASWAYKPAEYNLGVIYARGDGVPVDLPRALAWMALASERDEKHYVDAREAVYAEMSKAQFEQANVIWRELKPTYGDDVALRRAKTRWAQVRAGATGSHLGSVVGHLDVGTPAGGMNDASNIRSGSPEKDKAFQAKWGGANHTSSSSAEIFGGGMVVDGTTAYRQLRESNNPYDPKFLNPTLGTATVGKPTTVKKGEEDKGTTEPAKG
jgi:hypothetical protein